MEEEAGKRGELAIVLHTHLPFVRHPEHPEFLEEDWLYEALSETYLPLLDMALRLRREGIDFRLNLTLSPPLCEMLADELLMNRYGELLDRRLELLDSERARVSGAYLPTVEMYVRHFERCRTLMHEMCGGRPLRLFRELREAGCFELLTCGATHALLPFLATDEGRRAQIAVARRNHRKHFGADPRGIWLPECAYLPGFEELLAAEGLDYFILDAPGLLNGEPPPADGLFAPVSCPNGVAVFGRDWDSSGQIWSREAGYPGDHRYREFYRDLGFDGEYDYIGDHLGGAGVRKYLGIKYHKITGDVDLSAKDPYVPDDARAAAEDHARHFLRFLAERLGGAPAGCGGPPILTAAFDTELFGHWWFEGPFFLEAFIRRLAGSSGPRLVRLSDHLVKRKEIDTIRPAASSWGANGSFELWLGERNDWIYPHLRHAEREMVRLARREEPADQPTRRALRQAARELLLAQASDWAFLMATGGAPDYAKQRTRRHIGSFLELASMIDRGVVDNDRLQEMEERDTIFPEIDYRVFSGRSSEVGEE